MDKPVAIEILGKPILEGAMFAADAESHAEANTADRYAVHLVFGGVTPAAGDAPQQIIGFWSDSFGGDFVALGRGQAGQGQFEITYKYPDADYVNRWRIQGDRLSWTIVARGATGKEVPFATYSLSRGPC